MKYRRIALICLMFFATLTFVLSAYLVQGQRATSANMLATAPFLMDDEWMPVLFDAPEFALTDATGEAFDSGVLSGKWWIADFMFTSCPGACPVMKNAMQAIYEEFKAHDNLHFVSFTVDPDRDTPEVLAAFAEQYGADPARWHFLTGPKDTLHQLSYDGFKLGNITNPTEHSTRFVLVDPEGQIRALYEALDPAEMDTLKDDLRALL